MKDEVRWHGSRDKEVCPARDENDPGRLVTHIRFSANAHVMSFRESRGAVLSGVPPMEGFREGRAI
ncbi:hypothetical protein GCM10010911_36170 [Paenibacillus nasutitermitis]|uniref:Uncharacterized protein n=1 Tax=Paenibacillus nasutitermitis TaxID=1652958 RepID=A0A917DVH8_9BACL|nr:hypothetical protein GCM10010911_36170 [Paenibacillus nasutitermitis]